MTGMSMRRCETHHKKYDAKIEGLSRYIFSSPSWYESLGIILILGLFVDAVGFRINPAFLHLGTLGFILPGFLAFLFTGPLLRPFHRFITWNRSALLAASCTVFSVIITLLGALVSLDHLFLFFQVALGFIFGLRLLVLASITDYRIHIIGLAAFIQSFTGIILCSLILPHQVLITAPVVLILFGGAFSVLIWLIDRPLYRAFHIRGLSFLNAFIAHLTDGSKAMESFFREIGEEVFVPQTSFFFQKEDGNELLFTIPNLHPGPMGEIGGGNLPALLGKRFSEMVMVPHGCATHDFNLVSDDEIDKIVDAIVKTKNDLTYSREASLSCRVRYGSVSLLYQRFGDALLMVATRSPERTEDLEYAIGHAIMCEGHRKTRHIGFVDAHNCMTGDITIVLPASRIAEEYRLASSMAIDGWDLAQTSSLSLGTSHVPVPFSREQGFGDIGIQVMVAEVSGQRTGYILLDGNNMAEGCREKLRDHVLRILDEAEIMTTDSHVVNTISGKNPIGLCIPPEQIIPYLDTAIKEACMDVRPATVAGSTALCEGVVVFGTNSIAQLASIVNTILVYIVPVSFGVLLLAFLLSLFVYGIIQ